MTSVVAARPSASTCARWRSRGRAAGRSRVLATGSAVTTRIGGSGVDHVGHVAQLPLNRGAARLAVRQDFLGVVVAGQAVELGGAAFVIRARLFEQPAPVLGRR